MDEQHRQFGSRVKRIDRRHRKLADGFATNMTHDGLIIPVPRRRRLRVPFAGIAMLAVGLIVVKGMAYSLLGSSVYEARIASLAEGAQIERVGAWVMQADPLTVWVSDRVSALVHMGSSGRPDS
jgi:hypothetical protein